jgi:hypothetical protein
MDLARAPRRAPLTARKKGSGYENGFARVVGKLGTSLSNRAHRENFWCQIGGIGVSSKMVFCQETKYLPPQRL